MLIVEKYPFLKFKNSRSIQGDWQWYLLWYDVSLFRFQVQGFGDVLCPHRQSRDTWITVFTQNVIPSRKRQSWFPKRWTLAPNWNGWLPAIIQSFHYSLTFCDNRRLLSYLDFVQDALRLWELTSIKIKQKSLHTSKGHHPCKLQRQISYFCLVKHLVLTARVKRHT